jgi:hypothetical protein
MDMIESISNELQQFAHGADPATYFVVGLVAAAYWAIWELLFFLEIYRLSKILGPLLWLSWIILAASVVGYVWGSIPAEFLVAVPLAVWAQRMEAARETEKKIAEHLREQRATGAEGSPAPNFW